MVADRTQLKVNKLVTVRLNSHKVLPRPLSPAKRATLLLYSYLKKPRAIARSVQVQSDVQFDRRYILGHA